MKKHLKKLWLVLLIGIITTAPIPSRAFWGFGDVSLDPIQDASGIATQISQVTQVVNQVQMILKEFGLDVIIYKNAQKMSQKLLTKVLNKSNGGADGEGSKLFVENFEKYFEDISKQQLGDYTNQLSNSSNPFAQLIITGISNSAGGSRTSAQSLLEQFTLDDVVPEGVSWQDVGNDISLAGSKGWDYYSQLALPQNSPLGAAMIAQEELSQKISSAQNIAKTELGSSGFIPAKEISKYQELFSSFGGDTTGSPSPAGEDSGPRSENGPAAEDPSAREGVFQEQESFSNVNLDGNIKTPTKTNEDQAGQSVVESFERLRNADSFGKILFGTITQMVTGLIQQGFSKLGSDGGATSPLYGGPKDISKILNTRSFSWTNAPQQVVDLRNELDIGIQKTTLELAAIEKTIESVKKPLSDSSVFTDGTNHANGTILSLEYCIPGPDTGFDRRLTDYLTAQTKDTQNKAAADTDAGTKNAEALVQVRKNVSQAIAESKILIENPFLSLPGTSGMKSVLNDYYKGAKKFRGLVDSMIVKRQILNSLQVLRSEAQAIGELANNDEPLILFDSQWNKMSKTQRNTLYQKLTPDMIIGFPEFTTPSPAADGTVVLLPLPTNKAATPEDERDLEMKNRILAQQWDQWENKVPDASKQKIYARYVGLTQDISDSSTVQKAQLLAQGTDELYQELIDTLSDCKSIRSYLLDNPSAQANDPVFINTLKSARVRDSYRSPSILTAGDSDVDFEKLNRRLIDSEVGNTLQVTALSSNPRSIISNDREQILFCRLTEYETTYWKSTKGKPIGCRQQTISGDSDEASKKTNADWYHTNNGEILFLVSDDFQ